MRLAALLGLSVAGLLWLAPAALAQASFGPPTGFAAGWQPTSVAVGDFDGDSDPDLAVADFAAGAVLLGDGNGGFGLATNLGAGIGPVSVAVGDFDGDSDPDLAVANSNSGDVSVLLGDGSGGFGPATNHAVGSQPQSVAVGDFNGDQDPDLAVTDFGSGNVSVLLGDGSGGFGPETEHGAGTGPQSVAVGDFDGDSDPDLAVANSNSGDVSVLLGDGSGGFGPETEHGAGTGPQSVAVGDFDGDSDPDLAVANFFSNDVSVLLGDGNGGFDPTPNLAAGTSPRSVAVGDFNGDSDDDLAVADVDSGNVSVLLGDGNGGFGSATNFAAGDTPVAVAVGDFDGDLDPDLAVANLFTGVSVLLNTFNRPPSAAGDAYATDEDTPLEVAARGVLGNDSDRDRDALTAVLVSGPGHGRLTLNGDGSLSYVPDADYYGSDSFSYRASDGSLDSDPVTVTIEIRPVDESAPPAGAAPPVGSAASPERAIAQLRLSPRCVRPSRAGRVRIGMSLRMARPGPLQIRIDRAVGGGVWRSCPSPDPQRRFTGRFEKVATLSRRPGRREAAAASVVRRLSLRLKLSPGLYRITVRAKLDHGRLSRPLRRFLRVLG